MKVATRIGMASGIMLMLAGGALAQRSASATARKFIDRGNQDWITGMKTGNAAKIAAAYAADALDCGATGECERGRAAIQARYEGSIEKLGRARSAKVISGGSVRRGNFIYEWGSATATFAGGKAISGPYLTVWQHETDGSWKIFRNMALPTR